MGKITQIHHQWPSRTEQDALTSCEATTATAPAEDAQGKGGE